MGPSLKRERRGALRSRFRLGPIDPPPGAPLETTIVMRRFLVVTCVCAGVFVEIPAAQAGIEVGAAVRVITPDPLLPVSGGMGVPRPTKEKRGELTARAVVFRKGEVAVAVVAL